MCHATYDVIRTLDDAVDSWRVAYASYLPKGLIDPNPFGLYTAVEAIRLDSAIIVDKVDGVVVGTATAIVDGPGGLPLDRVFHDELELLRRAGRRLIEIGLAANTRRTGVLEPLRLAFHFGRHTSSTDFLCGIHPRRTNLYARLFGMEPLGSPCTHPLMRRQPIQLMRGVYDVVLTSSRLYRLEEIARLSVRDPIFASRYRLDPVALAKSPVARFIEYVLRKDCADRTQ